MRPAAPWAGDVLVHHVAKGNFVDVLTGNLEAWGQWGTGGDLNACHVEAFFDAGRQIAKMNPKASCLYDANTAPWDSISVLRLDLGAFAGFGVPQYPGRDVSFVLAFQASCNKHLGEAYAWDQILKFSAVGLLARVWPWAAQKLLSQSVKDGHGNVCSQWLTERIEDAVHAVYGHLHPELDKWDLFDGTNVGDGEERPADYIKSLYLKPVQG